MSVVIEVKNLKTIYHNISIHNGLNLKVNQGEIFGLLGPSGCGKTTLLREMVMLDKFHGGSIEILGHSLEEIRYNDAQKLRREWGVLFQAGALYSSLTLEENIALPLKEYTDLSPSLIKEIVEFKINIVGLKSKDALLYPSQISGGMKKKAALARALSMDPKLLFLDEPTSGLDPISAREFDTLILKLRSLLGLSIVMVSHDLKSIYDTLDRVAVIDNQKIAYEGTLDGVSNADSKFVKTFFRDRINYE